MSKRGIFFWQRTWSAVQVQASNEIAACKLTKCKWFFWLWRVLATKKKVTSKFLRVGPQLGINWNGFYGYTGIFKFASDFVIFAGENIFASGLKS